jgi:putative transposase
LTGKIADELHLLPLKKVQELDVMIKALKIIPSHVHLFIENNQTEAFYHPANHFKDYISRMSHFEFLQQRSRLPSIWSRSYHVDPIGYVSDETVKYYIKMQKKRVNL